MDNKLNRIKNFGINSDGSVYRIEKVEGTECQLPSPILNLTSPGLFQSPIAISRDKVTMGCKSELKFDYISPTDINVTIENHDIKATLSQNSTSTLTIGGNIFYLRQFHLHTPSEHCLDGTRSGAEAHLVHTLNEVNAIAVMSIRINPPKKEYSNEERKKLDTEKYFDNSFLECLLREAQKIKDGTQQSGKCNIDIIQLLPKTWEIIGNTGTITKYYSYHGSLTTSPFTENVQWILPTSTIEVRDDIIAGFKEITGMNARDIQTMGNHTVDYCESGT